MPDWAGRLLEVEIAMGESGKTSDKSTWAVGGGLLLGLGVGFFFLQQSALAFVGCMVGGLGLGMMVTSIISTVRRG